METENIEKPMNQMSEKYQQFQNRAREFGTRAREKAKDMSVTTDTYVHENPWMSVGIVALSALMLGLFLGATATRRD